MKYSFVVPAYKDTFLRQALDSIMAQTVADFELIVVNDCSPYDIDSIMADYPHAQYHKNERNLGREDLVGSWNHAISFAQGEWLIVASDDDIYAPNFLEQADRLMALHPECDLIRGRVARINESDELRDEECAFDEYIDAPSFAYHLMANGILCAANYIYRRKAFLAKGGFVSFPCAWFTDIATAMLMAANGVLSTPGITFCFRHSDLQLTTDNRPSLLRQKLQAMMQCIEWQREFFASLPPAPLLVPARYKTRQHIINTICDHMRHIPLMHLGMWSRYVFRNSFLYGYEKADMIASRLVFILRS